MRLGLRLSFLLPLFALIACGSNSPSFGTIGTPSGDWILNLESTTASGYFPGALTIQGSNVSGVFQYVNPSATCTPGTQPITVTGTVNASGNAINLTSSSFGTGSVATFTIQLPLIQNSTPNYTSGTVQIAGGNCALGSTALNINFVNLAGNFSGTLSSSKASGSVNLSVGGLIQLSNGEFSVSNASIAFGSSTCNISFTGMTGTIEGYNLQLTDGANTITINAFANSFPIALSVTPTNTMQGLALSANCGGTLAGTVD